MPERRLVGLKGQMAETALPITQRALQQAVEILLAQRTQLENLRAGHQRRVDEEKWIMRRRSDQPHRAAFDIRQQNILLRLVEAMNLIDEKNRRLASVLQTICRPGQDAPHVGDVRFDTA